MDASARIKTIGVMTGGGDAPGLNAVIRAVVKTADRLGIKCVGVEDGYEGLLRPGKVRPLGYAEVRGILPRGGTILGTSNRGNPFSFRVVENGESVLRDCSQEAADRMREIADAMIVIGGDGSLSIAHGLREKGARIVGVPKTIDNDISATDQTFGFDTALTTATDALDKLHTTAEAHHRVMIVEVMGRDAGWIALHAGLAGGADVILIPEIPYAAKHVCAKIHERERGGNRFSIVVIAEGCRSASGDRVIREGADDSGIVRLGGIGHALKAALDECCSLEVRVTVLGHLQRGGSPTPYDRILGTRLGSAAVHLAVERRFDHMVALRGTRIEAVPLAEAIKRQKLVDPEDELVRVARDTGISFGDR